MIVIRRHGSILACLTLTCLVLVAGGWSVLLLSAFHWLIDVRGWTAWSIPFVWIGMNAIVLYMAENLIRVHDIANRFVGGPVAALLDAQLAVGAGQVITLCAQIGLIVLCAWFLYRKQLFLRL